MNNNRFVLLDMICYVVFPLAVWNITRDHIGDYYAMLLSSIPGIVYTIYRFKALKKVNFFGIYMIVTLVVGTLIYVLAGVFLLTILIRRPIALYFALDFVELQGYDRGFSKKLFYKKIASVVQFNWHCLYFSKRIARKY